MQGLNQRFRCEILRGNLIRPGRHVLVACSGGLDSVVLLHLLRFGCAGDYQLSVAHFDHRMRPKSEADAVWLRGLCAAWELPLHTDWAKKMLLSEAEARRARYRFLRETADAIGAHHIATGHHADDQVETVLFRVQRGTGLDGLAGIPRQRGRIVRPLLTYWRSELEDYAKDQRLNWMTDPTNTSRRYARNRIRHDVIPALETQSPGLKRLLLGVARQAAATRCAWKPLLRRLESNVVMAQDVDSIELARPILLEYHREIRTRLLRGCLARLGSRPGRSGTAAIETFISAGESGSGIDVQGGLRLLREFDTVRLVRVRRAGLTDHPLEIESPNAGSGEITIGGTRYRVHWSPGGNAAAADSVSIDPTAVRFPLAIRAWQPGDRIRLRVGSKKLKKLFAERRLGRERRHAVPVLVDTNGTVLWVAGLVRSNSAEPLVNETALCITVSDGEPN
jgi:tRNA(Ile)-lysidine synthase